MTTVSIPTGAEWEKYGTQSSRTNDGGQGRQRHVLDPLPLMNFVGSSEANTGSVDFRVEVPDSRLRVQLAIIGNPRDGSSVDFIGTKGLTLWLRAIEDSQFSGDPIPITDLWGTSGDPGPIPGEFDNTGTIVAVPTLGGWGKEFVTAGNAIMGTIDYPEVENTGPGDLILQVRYVPEGFRIPWEEWDEIRRQCGRRLIGSPLMGAG